MKNFDKEITLNISFEESYNAVLGITKIQSFIFDSEDKVLNKIVLKFQIWFIEIQFEPIADNLTKLLITPLIEKNEKTDINEMTLSTEGIIANFETALNTIIRNSSKRNKKKKSISRECEYLLNTLIVLWS